MLLEVKITFIFVYVRLITKNLWLTTCGTFYNEQFVFALLSCKHVNDMKGWFMLIKCLRLHRLWFFLVSLFNDFLQLISYSLRFWWKQDVRHYENGQQMAQLHGHPTCNIFFEVYRYSSNIFHVRGKSRAKYIVAGRETSYIHSNILEIESQHGTIFSYVANKQIAKF